MARAKRNHPARAVGAAISKPPGDDNVVAGDIISLIRQSALSLSPSEQRVATVLLADMEFAVHASNSELARRARVSEPTVTRFSRSVGCRGVRDLKVRLAQAMAVGRIYVELPRMSGPIWRAPRSGGRCFRKFAVQLPLPRRDFARRTSSGLPKLSPAVRSLQRSGWGRFHSCGGGGSEPVLSSWDCRLACLRSELDAHDCRDLRTG